MPLAPGDTRFSFALLWTFATFGGFLLSLLLIEVGEKPDIGVVEAAIGGFAVALPQGCLLKQPTSCIRWILSSVLGWAVITATGLGGMGWIAPSTQLLPLRLLHGIIYGTIGGFGIGLAQWLAIPQPFPWAWRWIFVSSASWAVALPLGSFVGSVLRHLTQLFLGEVMGLAITWFVVGILTGIDAHKLRS
ncbi:hypothetical protein FNW02_04585 [Komarekiella sp. 'clone 1']|uniref:Uncharacterized protein n=1 Tax=Komarekiella delphini-convector SJRDD-AB1 TaxID=2593771 RepID=A0AA40SUC8_9NOST|nr:hypothetical protein [Komarekiella delphini-convector]MBD6615145.1 hypothetical protein [Komarekiella delphini-convector SJRDD-AB1]